MASRFDLQGHRGARGLKPENTLASFEIAFDLGVTSVETDVNLTCDGVPLLCHDAIVSTRLFRRLAHGTGPDPTEQPFISRLSLSQLRGYAADRNPDPSRFEAQDASVTPLADLFARERGIDPYAPAALSDLFAFAEAYAGDLGRRAGKTPAQQAHARQVGFDLELKRVPFRPELIGDSFDGQAAGLLEHRVVEAVLAAGVVSRTTVRSFDHRAVSAVRRLEQGITGALLVAGTALRSPGKLVRQADAQTFCPDVNFLDEAQVRDAHAEGVRVIPWTVNRPEDWQRLLDWGADGVTTDFPDRLARWLHERGLSSADALAPK